MKIMKKNGGVGEPGGKPRLSKPGKKKEEKKSDGMAALFGDTLCPCIGFDNIEGETTITFDKLSLAMGDDDDDDDDDEKHTDKKGKGKNDKKSKPTADDDDIDDDNDDDDDDDVDDDDDNDDEKDEKKKEDGDDDDDDDDKKEQAAAIITSAPSPAPTATKPLHKTKPEQVSLLQTPHHHHSKGDDGDEEGHDQEKKKGHDEEEDKKKEEPKKSPKKANKSKKTKKGKKPSKVLAKVVSYPADLGARCEAWDNGRHPLCKEGQTPGFSNGWCSQQWCFVDPCNCQLPVLPKMSGYIPDARYRGKPLFYSYATCGGEDMYSKVQPELGKMGCQCIGFDNVPGETEVVLKGKKYSYPAEIGGSCRAWDAKIHPECEGKHPPSWCRARWCYVDPCSCNLETAPKVTMYFPAATFTGKSLYYSYETCDSKDTFTEEHNLRACVNQEDEKECLSLERPDGEQKCAWTGKKCIGAELVNHPLCESLASTERGAAYQPAFLSSASILATVAAFFA
eukprot:CAMPEP_0206445608 /NCGR_PEP_ID=MMETSP0324_2-20121206/15623_1 /ASSEMBLY_ACC=CAM_ASM_000836 /TAXON_ID=2866 /ORGANISM="Crypthecodinium cohnii, Strain Seligo" /LENGTH=507 /DNA_ID=CAMNT_0053913883 /DNA_START=282 /DNA_END=1804 /DNA_ORIENTATION=+